MYLSSVFNIIGRLLMFLAATMLLPVPFSLYFGGEDYIALSISSGITLVFGFTLYWFFSIERDLRPKEGFAVVTLGWVFLSLFGAIPFVIDGAIPSFTDAFFETMSGFTTTGATILTNIEEVPEGILLWRSLTHWIGGMGIIVLSLAILPFLGVGGMQLFKAEVPGPTADKLTPRITQTAKILWGVYLLLTAAHAVLLMFGGMSFFESVCHSLATMATGGYSTRNTSIAAFSNSYIHYVIILFMLIAGTNFSLHYRFFRGDRSVYFRNQEFRVYLSIIGLATTIIAFDTLLAGRTSIFIAFRDTLFQVVSIVTTTGYGTADYEQWSTTSQIVLYFLMFVGGCAGSTSGGMKVIRIYLLIKFVFSEFTRLLHPHAVVSVRIGKSVISREVLTNITGFSVLFMLIYAAGVLVMTMLGLDMLSALGAVAASLGNIGPGLGSVGPTDNYAHIPVFGKWLLSFLMLAGRLELFTVIILLSPSFWKK